MRLPHLITASLAVLSLIAGSAVAGIIDIKVTTGSGDTWSMTQEGVRVSDTVFRHHGEHTDANWGLAWDIEADPDPYVQVIFPLQTTTSLRRTSTSPSI